MSNQREKIKIPVVLLFVIMTSILLLGGCKQPTPAMTPAQLRPIAPSTLTLSPGDELEVKFFFAPELNERQFVRPDGKITLLLVGEIVAEGKTPSELQSELKDLYAKELKQPEVAVIVRSLADQVVYVGGEVNRPTQVELKGTLTAIEAIIRAGGFNPQTAELRNVVIVRHQNGKRYGCALDFSDTLAGKASTPFYLAPHDIVYVPRTVIAQVTQWIDQYINKMIPRTGMIFSTPLGAGTLALDMSTAIAIP